jgi:hypothetical protein
MNRDETLDALIERVRGLEGPDRETDAEVDVAVFGGETVWTPTRYTNEQFPASRRPSKHHVGGFENEHVPTYTASLDAVIALIERELPGHLKGLMLRALDECDTLEQLAGFVRVLLAEALTAIKEQRND